MYTNSIFREDGPRGENVKERVQKGLIGINREYKSSNYKSLIDTILLGAFFTLTLGWLAYFPRVFPQKPSGSPVFATMSLDSQRRAALAASQSGEVEKAIRPENVRLATSRGREVMRTPGQLAPGRGGVPRSGSPRRDGHSLQQTRNASYQTPVQRRVSFRQEAEHQYQVVVENFTPEEIAEMEAQQGERESNMLLGTSAGSMPVSESRAIAMTQALQRVDVNDLTNVMRQLEAENLEKGLTQEEAQTDFFSKLNDITDRLVQVKLEEQRALSSSVNEEAFFSNQALSSSVNEEASSSNQAPSSSVNEEASSSNQAPSSNVTRRMGLDEFQKELQKSSSRNTRQWKVKIGEARPERQRLLYIDGTWGAHAHTGPAFSTIKKIVEKKFTSGEWIL